MAVHQIVIIGASFAGLNAAHGLLKKVLPPLSTGGKTFKVVQIAPHEEFYWKIGAPRVLVDPESLPLEKALLPIAPGFARYSPEQYEFIKAEVTSIDPSAKTVTTDTSATVHWDSLIIASGTVFSSPIWSIASGSDALKKAIKDIHERLPSAESVLVAGGGAGGVETAGELGYVYGNKKQITLLSGTTHLLSSLHNQKIGQDAASRLKQLGVEVINDNVRVVEHTQAGGKHVLKLSNGETKTVDIYFEAVGDKPNSKFVPNEWLDEKQRIKTDAHTLRLDVPDVTGVYVFGSVGSYSSGSMLDIMFASGALLESIKNDISGQAPGPRTKNIYKKVTSDMMFVPIGPQQGVGAAFGWKLPSFLIKMAKSKDFMIGNAAKTVEGTA
ncbi:hypothetical protein PV10_05357 [Exophiala mesophila]|uniref:FAD/NAD(P)-binding domain-containing protein n=1 Tax=Exophiala mesophila TaxID=212818 RepID=A0A0D1XRK0_EXOME|nr:uncharacterized protein PV10_05357 [Exophiala mesophila]KIV90731.1 hypothetical protein PV10_05357 [Exophiala mesophila]